MEVQLHAFLLSAVGLYELLVSWIGSRGTRLNAAENKGIFSLPEIYRGADKSLAPPGRKQANVSVRMAWISFGALPCRKKKIDDSSRLDAVEITSVPDMRPSLFPSWLG